MQLKALISLVGLLTLSRESVRSVASHGDSGDYSMSLSLWCHCLRGVGQQRGATNRLAGAASTWMRCLGTARGTCLFP